jgi:NNP family nitrate/nitrite transporter-like MFS transporter
MDNNTETPRRPAFMLALATIGFAVNFWAWALLSPLGPRFKDLVDLSGAQQTTAREGRCGSGESSSSIHARS